MDLKDQLDELTEDLGRVIPPTDLWQRGTRQARVRRLTVAGAVAALVVALVGMFGAIPQSVRPAPASYPGGVGFPDYFGDPSPWMRAGSPKGPFAGVTTAKRLSLWGSEGALAAVSATNGAYGWVDLPDRADTVEAPALSSDGRYLTYWLTGMTQEQGHDPVTDRNVTGLAVLDTETSKVWRAEIPTQHGISPETLVWLNSETVLAIFDQWDVGFDGPADQQGFSRPAEPLIWRFASGDPEPAKMPGGIFGPQIIGTGADSLVVKFDDQRLASVVSGPPWDGTPVQLVFPGTWGACCHSAAVSRGGVVAAPFSGTRRPSEIRLGNTDKRWAIPNNQRPVFQIWSWLDDSHVVAVHRRDGAEPSGDNLTLSAINVRNGQERVIAQVDHPMWQFASDLFSAPSVKGKMPPDPRTNPRGWAIFGGFVTLGLLIYGGLRLVGRR